MIQEFISSKAIANVVDTGRTTPMGSPMLQIYFEDGTYEYMPEKRFLIIKTQERVNDTVVRGLLVSAASREMSSVMYSLLLEYGCKLSEIDLMVSQVINLTNNASEKASNILWGVDYADQRTLNQINDILIQNGPKDVNNAGSSGGKGAPASDTK